jgi:hypothetical protein
MDDPRRNNYGAIAVVVYYFFDMPLSSIVGQGPCCGIRHWLFVFGLVPFHLVSWKGLPAMWLLIVMVIR